MAEADYDEETGLPLDRSYLEKDLPELLQDDIKKWLEYENHPTQWDIWYDNLNSTINMFEVEDVITSEQAWYLREKYLGRSKEDNCMMMD